MKSIILKLRIAGVVAFLLFMASMFLMPTDINYQFTQIQSILIVVSFVIFAILIVFHIYEIYLSVNANREEADS